jgi:hypothetical protein
MESQWHIGWRQKGINGRNGEDKICSHWVYNGFFGMKLGFHKLGGPKEG